MHTSRFQFRQKAGGGGGQTDLSKGQPIAQGKAWISLAATGCDSPALLVADPRGNLFSLNCVDKPQPCDTTSGLRHATVVFSLIAIPNSPHLFISFGMDAQIIVWKCDHGDWRTLKPVTSHVYLTNKISSMCQGFGACSPLAVGLTDGNLLLLRNMSPPAPGVSVSMNRLSPLPPSGNSTGISAMAWHPDPQFEHLLALGSNKGHVDVIDVTKPPKRGRTFNSLEGCVYRVAWGPRLFQKAEITEESEGEPSQSRLFAYAVGKSCVFVLASPKKPPVNLAPDFHTLMSHPSDSKLADIAFLRTEGSSVLSWLIALGSVNGAVNLFGLTREGPTVVPLCRVFLHKKCINAMSWSHHTDRHLLAVGSNHSFVTVIDATEYTQKAPPAEPIELTSCLATLEGHGNRIVSLDWSPHDHDLLLSTSFDCTATVWRVELSASSSVASYRGHFSKVLTCAWSANHPDFVLTGEEIGYLAGWRPTEQSAKAPPASRKHRQPAASIPTHGRGDAVDENPKPREEVEVKPTTTTTAAAKKNTPGSAKQLSLLPGLFATPSTIDCAMLALSSTPPITVPSRLSVITDFLDFIKDPTSLPDDRILPEFDLLHTNGSRRRLIRFVEAEALRHYNAAMSGAANKRARLDAYFSLLLWLGRAEAVQRGCVETQHMPFRLMWALEMCLKGTASVGGCLVEGEKPGDENDFLQQKVSENPCHD